MTRKTSEQSVDIDIQIEPADAKIKAKRSPPEAMIRQAMRRTASWPCGFLAHQAPARRN